MTVIRIGQDYRMDTVSRLDVFVNQCAGDEFHIAGMSSDYGKIHDPDRSSCLV